MGLLVYPVLTDSEVKQSGEKVKSPKIDLEELMKNLDLKDSEIDDVFLGSEEVESMKQNMRWMAVAKVHTMKTISDISFHGNMMNAWGLARFLLQSGGRKFVRYLDVLLRGLASCYQRRALAFLAVGSSD